MTRVHVYSDKQMEDMKKEFVRIKDTCYLDHAGTTLYSEKQLQSIFSDLSTNLYGSPHARSTSSESTNDTVDIIRYKVLSFFNTSPEEYSVIFTAGATSALKLVAETFDFQEGTMAYLEDNHTSVLGMRSLVPNCREIKVEDAINNLSKLLDSQVIEVNGRGNGLFVYPAQSNFAGTKYPLTWIEAVKYGALRKLSINVRDWYTLLDAANFASTNQLDLSRYKPDFVTISFYKIFGYPTGLGALLVRKPSENVLRKKYFGGGTILMALSSENIMVPKINIHERYEDGTISFLSILSLTHGFDTLRRLHLTCNLISQHVFHLAKYTFEHLSQMHHSNGKPVAVLYNESGYDNIEEQGGIINFNLKRFNGCYVGYAEVHQIADLHGIRLRTGCFCNPGACQKFLNLCPEDIKKHFEEGHVCGDQHDLVDGQPTGSVRISFGYMSTYEDADRFLSMIETCFVTQPVVRKRRNSSKNSSKEEVSSHTTKQTRKCDQIANVASSVREENETGELVHIYIYPVKSCAPFEVNGSWKLTNIGLEYDRRWMIINASGSGVSQKQIKNLCTLKPTLDFSTKSLRLKINDSEIAVPLEPSKETYSSAYFCDSKVCGDKVQGYDCGDKVAEWLSDNLEKPGLRLLRQCDFSDNVSGRTSKQGEQTILSLANKAEYLLINLASIRWLRERLPQENALHHSPESIMLRFRANLVVDFEKPFVENDLDIIYFNEIAFKFSGHCTRCQMICIDQETGEISKEPLQTLSRELQGKMRFGIYLSQCNISAETNIKPYCLVKAYFKKNIE